MTRWAMVADLRRCVGCQTCTAACKHTNATSPAVQWRRVLDFEMGEFPDVNRTFVPVGCMHCEDPPCMHVCPSTATGQRADGIVTIDYDLCIGCSYCAVACPYQARFKIDKPLFAFGAAGRTRNEAQREDPARLGVAQKCTFCADRIDEGLANGLTPGVDHDASPACVNSCIASALSFGDLDDPNSNVSKLLTENQSFRMHEELGTSPGFHYVWAGGDEESVATAEAAKSANPGTVVTRGATGVGGIAPWLQQHWDWRAAGNFIGGGTGTGILAATGLAVFLGVETPLLLLAGLGFVGLGLFLVFLETGRPFRAPLNVFFHPGTSWMTREAIVGAALFPVALAGAWLGAPPLVVLSGLVALGFLYCQARILKASKGIPSWRQPEIVPLIMATGLTEGLGAALALHALVSNWPAGVLVPLGVTALVALLGARIWAYGRYRKALTQEGAPKETLSVLSKFTASFMIVGHVLPVALIGAVFLVPTFASGLAAAAGVLAAFGGWRLKYVLVTKAAYNQGFAIDRSPLRGQLSGAGGKPGWSKS